MFNSLEQKHKLDNIALEEIDEGFFFLDGI